MEKSHLKTENLLSHQHHTDLIFMRQTYFQTTISRFFLAAPIRALFNFLIYNSPPSYKVPLSYKVLLSCVVLFSCEVLLSYKARFQMNWDSKILLSRPHLKRDHPLFFHINLHSLPLFVKFAILRYIKSLHDPIDTWSKIANTSTCCWWS